MSYRRNRFGKTVYLPKISLVCLSPSAGPSDKLFDPQTNYLTSAELGYPLEKLSWVDNDEANEVAWGKILQAPYVGLDTEFSTGKISLCKIKSKLAVVQIATPSEVFVFDGLALAESKAFKLGV